MARYAFIAAAADRAAGGAVDFAARFVEERMAEAETVGFHAGFPDRLLDVLQVAPEHKQHVGDVDIDRAGLFARAAETAGKGQRRGVFDAIEERRDDRADGSGIDPAIAVTADILIDRAGVQA